MLCADQTSTDCVVAAGRLPAPRFVVRECASIAMAGEPHTLIGGEIHVWRATAFMSRLDEDEFRKVLSADERARMARFHFDIHRRNFLFCRSMLRILLASYVGTAPDELVFMYSAHGKPSLATSSGNVEFNLSHSDGNLLIALSQRRKLGVDIECLNRDLNVLEISRRFFSPAESRALESLPQAARHRAFFACWTRKEALVKALGQGLSCPLDSFDVSINPDHEEVDLVTRAGTQGEWALHSLNQWLGCAAAVAVEVTNTGVASL